MDFEAIEAVNKEIAAQERRFSRQDRRQSDEDMREIMSTEAGRRFVAGLLARGQVFSQFAKNAIDNNNPLELAYRNGRRDFANGVYLQANAVSPEMVVKMFAERNAVDRERQTRRNELHTKLETLQEKDNNDE